MMMFAKVFLTVMTIETAVLTLMIAPDVTRENALGGFYIMEVFAICVLAFGGMWL